MGIWQKRDVPMMLFGVACGLRVATWLAVINPLVPLLVSGVIGIVCLWMVGNMQASRGKSLK